MYVLKQTINFILIIGWKMFLSTKYKAILAVSPCFKDVCFTMLSTSSNLNLHLVIFWQLRGSRDK